MTDIRYFKIFPPHIHAHKGHFIGSSRVLSDFSPCLLLPDEHRAGVGWLECRLRARRGLGRQAGNSKAKRKVIRAKRRPEPVYKDPKLTAF